MVLDFLGDFEEHLQSSKGKSPAQASIPTRTRNQVRGWKGDVSDLGDRHRLGSGPPFPWGHWKIGSSES